MIIIVILAIIFILFFAVSFSIKETSRIDKHEKYKEAERESFKNKDESSDDD